MRIEKQSRAFGKFGSKGNLVWSSLKFGTEFHQVTGHTLQMFEVKGEGHSAWAQGNVSAANRYNMAADRLSNFKLGMVYWRRN